jgi:transcriptional regulator with XRE-family HTH domain
MACSAILAVPGVTSPAMAGTVGLRPQGGSQCPDRDGKAVTMPVTRELDPAAGPVAFFGAEVRLARAAAGLSQEQLGLRLGYSAAQVGKVETGERPPSADFARGCDQALPEAGGLFTRIYALVQRWDGGYPSWFTEWVEAERRADTLCWWEPLLVPGLAQTADYARALFEAWRLADEDDLDQLVTGRMDRQRIFERSEPPSLWIIIDEAVLHRRIGSEKVMYDQLTHLAQVADRPRTTVQVIPGDVGAHVGLLGAFAIAGVDGAGIIYMESPDQGQTTRALNSCRSS